MSVGDSLLTILYYFFNLDLTEIKMSKIELLSSVGIKDPIEQFKHKTSQPQFDKEAIERWRKQAPEYYRQYPGVNYNGTYIKPKVSVEYIDAEQVRELAIILGNVPPLAKSLLNGIDYTKPPPTFEEVNGHDKGRSGWTRIEAIDTLGWLHYFFDKLTFDSPLDRARYMTATNRVFIPLTGNTVGDIMKSIRGMLDKDFIHTEKQIWEEVNFLYVEGSDEDRKVMVDNLKVTAGLKVGNFRPYHSQSGKYSTQMWAEKNNAPHGIDKNLKIKDRVGQIMHSATALGTWLGMIVGGYEKSVELEKRVVCESRAYIKNIKPADFPSQRQMFDKKYDLTQQKLERVIRHCVSIDENGEIKVDLGVRWHGFLPQDETKDPNNGGLAVELSEVDKNGKPMKK